jgi:hypothetical protein
MPMRFLCPRSEDLETAHDLGVNLPIRCAPCPASPRLAMTRRAVEEELETERLLTSFRDEAGVMSRDQLRVQVKYHHQHAVMKDWPIRGLLKLP